MSERPETFAEALDLVADFLDLADAAFVVLGKQAGTDYTPDSIMQDDLRGMAKVIRTTRQGDQVETLWSLWCAVSEERENRK